MPPSWPSKPDHYRFLTNLARLWCLNIQWPPRLGAEEVAALARLTQLQNLTIRSSAGNLADFSPLFRLEGLTNLVVDGGNWKVTLQRVPPLKPEL